MESDILYNLSKGEKTAFKYVFDTYYKSVCLFIQKYIYDADHAEDIAQEIFIIIWNKKLFFPNIKAFKSYLYQTAKNKALNVIEHEAVKKRHHEIVKYDRKTEEFFYQNYIEQETYRLILQTIDKLPPRPKEILYLNLEGYKNKEIANQLDISINTVRSHKASAYKYLKMNLKELISFASFILLNIR